MKKKKQKNKRWVQVYSTTIRNVALKVNFCTNHKTNITSLNGYLIDVKTRIRHDADVSVSTSVQDARDIDRMVKVLIARATAVYEKKCTAATPDGTGGLTKIYNSLSASDTALLCPPKMLAASSRRHNQQRRVVSREQAYCGESQFAAQLRRRICAAGRTDQQHGGRGRAAFAQHIRAAPGKRRRALRGPHTAPIHDAPAAGRHTRGVLSRLHGSICASLPGDRASAHPVEERKNDQQVYNSGRWTAIRTDRKSGGR